VRIGWQAITLAELAAASCLPAIQMASVTIYLYCQCHGSARMPNSLPSGQDS
jgi:hypothetical protein